MQKAVMHSTSFKKALREDNNVYIVTASNISPETQQLIDWFLSEQGQQLIEDVGYIRL